mgnify:FL=1|jgi:hypothetical protein
MYPYGGLYVDIPYLLYVLPALILASWAQIKINSDFNKYSRVSSETGLSGVEVARTILDRNGLNDVRIEKVSGNLTDHYDPRTRVLRLSNGVYGSTSIAAMSVAAHETGHAIQHSEGYFPLILRNNIAPIANIGARMVWVFILLGFLASEVFIEVGIALFLAVVLFQVVTLPVEFNASRRAMLQLENGIAPQDKLKPAKKVLTSAALTYVASTLVAIGQLLRILTMTNRRRD